MKKSLFAFLMIAVLAVTFTSCKKEKEEGPVNLTNNSFAVNGKVIKGNATIGSIFSANTLLLISEDTVDASTVMILFKAKPAASGDFNFKGILQLKDLGVSDLILSVTSGGKTYVSTTSNTEKVKVEVNSGKLKVTVPEVTIAEATGTGTIKFQGILVEN
ncbi:MAG: hypothetical protein LC105_11020 [Chitinophagales bacterium]|nr:hypothetical protein [Chitinophagales bacterium]MCZ2394381.1 hypothetical protein [Chitinophagales bacterium]